MRCSTGLRAGASRCTSPPTRTDGWSPSTTRGPASTRRSARDCSSASPPRDMARVERASASRSSGPSPNCTAAAPNCATPALVARCSPSPCRGHERSHRPRTSVLLLVPPPLLVPLHVLVVGLLRRRRRLRRRGREPLLGHRRQRCRIEPCQPEHARRLARRKRSPARPDLLQRLSRRRRLPPLRLQRPIDLRRKHRSLHRRRAVDPFVGLERPTPRIVVGEHREGGALAQSAIERGLRFRRARTLAPPHL